MKMNRKLLTIIVAILFAVTACFTACMTTTKQAELVEKETKSSRISSVALIPFWGPDKKINDQFEKTVYAAVKKMKDYNLVSVNTADIPIPYENPDPSLIEGYDCALTGELRRDPDDPDYWHLTLYLWQEKRLIFSDNVSGYSAADIGDTLPGLLEWLFSWLRRENSTRGGKTVTVYNSSSLRKKVIIIQPEESKGNATVSSPYSVALVPFWGSNQPPQQQRQSLIQRGMATVELVADGLCAAHPSLPRDSKAKVTNIANGKEIEVTITGRINPDGTRVIDLSPDAARALDIGKGGPVIINQILAVRVRQATEPQVTEQSSSVPISVSIIEQFGAELYAAMGNMKNFQPVRIDMTYLPDDVPEGGFPPFICPSPSLIKANPYALTGEVTRNDTGSLSLRLYLWEMADTRLVYTSKLTARNMNEYRSLLPGLLEKLFSQTKRFLSDG